VSARIHYHTSLELILERISPLMIKSNGNLECGDIDFMLDEWNNVEPIGGYIRQALGYHLPTIEQADWIAGRLLALNPEWWRKVHA
jgi:hypothetical protein